MDELIKSDEARPARLLSVPELIDSFLAAQDIREVSRVAYRNGLKRFLAWLETNQITQPDREAILRFKTFLQEAKLAANTVNSYLVAVKRFFAYLEGMRLYPDIAKNIKGVQQPKNNLRESPTAGQVKDILSSIPTGTTRGKRDFAIVNLMARTGLRSIEIIRADVGDIRQEAGEALLYVQGKGRDSKDEFVLLTVKALRPVLDYLEVRGKVNPEDPLFVSHSDRNKGERLTTRTVRGVSKFYLREIGLDKKQLSAHSLRHFAITTAIRRGARIEQTQAMARHSCLQTTMGYYHNLDRVEQAAERYIDF